MSYRISALEIFLAVLAEEKQAAGPPKQKPQKGDKLQKMWNKAPAKKEKPPKKEKLPKQKARDTAAEEDDAIAQVAAAESSFGSMQDAQNSIGSWRRACWNWNVAAGAGAKQRGGRRRLQAGSQAEVWQEVHLPDQ